jgi:hypothetical protein
MSHAQNMPSVSKMDFASSLPKKPAINEPRMPPGMPK